MTTLVKEMNILWVILSHFGKGAGIKAHKHEYHHVFYVHRGNATFVVNGQQYELGAGCAIFASKGVVHELLPIDNQLTIMSEIKFSLSSKSLESAIQRLSPLIPPSDLNKALIDRIMDESVRLSAASQTAMKSYLYTLLYNWTADVRHSADDDSAIIETEGFSPVSKAIVRYLEENYKNNFDLQAVADAVGYNKNYLCSIFKKDSGITVGDCLYLIRVRKAAEFISYSDMELAQVAENTGFSNVSHFNRVFRQITDIPPGQYRRYYNADIRLKEDSLDKPPTLPPTYNEAFVVSVLAGKKVGPDMILKYSHLPETSEETME